MAPPLQGSRPTFLAILLASTWKDEFEKINRLAAEHAELEFVFLGNSITQGLTGAKDWLARPQRPRS